MIGFVWFGLFEVIFRKLKRPLKLARASLELHLRTIPGGVVGSGCPIVIIRLTQTELKLKIG